MEKARKLGLAVRMLQFHFDEVQATKPAPALSEIPDRRAPHEVVH